MSCACRNCSRSRASFIDATLPAHKRVDDPFGGWTTESNIYWRDALFTRIEHGNEDVGIPDGERRLFWVRLKIRDLDRPCWWPPRI